MKFVKGIIIGSAIATGVAVMYNEGIINPNKMMKKGKKMAKKMGII